MTPWLGPDGQQARRLELHLSYTCPQDCAFCSEGERMAAFRPYPVTWGRVARVLREQAGRGITSVHFTGGEPTVHPHLAPALRLARKLGMETALGSNGAVLARPAAARRLYPLLDEVMLSLHGPTAEVHDAATRTPGSFARVRAAFAHAAGHPVRIFANTVVTRQNLEHVPATVALAEAWGARLVIVSNVAPEGAALLDYDALAPDLAALAAAVPAIVAKSRGTLRFFGIPLCLLGAHAALSNDLHWDPRVTFEWVEAPGRVAFDAVQSWAPDRQRTKVEACVGCTRRGVCGGVYAEYARTRSTAALKPFGDPS